MAICSHNFLNLLLILFTKKLITEKKNMSINHAVALRINQLLEEKGITCYRLAMKSGISHSTLKNIMLETIKDNLISTITLIAWGFDMTVSQFFDSPLFSEENLDI